MRETQVGAVEWGAAPGEGGDEVDCCAAAGAWWQLLVDESAADAAVGLFGYDALAHALPGSADMASFGCHGLPPLG